MRKRGFYLHEGIVLRASNGIYTVHSENLLFHCTLRGNLKKQFQYTTSGSLSKRVVRVRKHPSKDALSVGDRVLFEPTSNGSAVIENVLPRTSRFTRQGFRGAEQTVVCNLDQLLITFAYAEPYLDPWKLDRFLVAAEAERLLPVIVANKYDLISSNPDAESVFEDWSKLGYLVISVSVKQPDGIDRVREVLNGKVSAFVGPSGVGKSSILNAIIPGLKLKTSDIGYVTYKGKHTTTTAQLIPFNATSWVADTPGLRQLDLLKLSPDELFDCFPEFEPYKGLCHFFNCRHLHEPGCALKTAVDTGVISSRRYRSYTLLTQEMDSIHS